MREQVLRYIRERKLISPGERVLVAVSGGADSVALLRVLLELRSELGIVLAVAHFNHGLRGETSDKDAHFVAETARGHKLDLFLAQRSVSDYAAMHRRSVESVGRELRYEWLTNIAEQARFDAVATGHTLDDQAETVLMKFLRGAGSKGLAGIYPEMRRGENRQIRFVRPFLSTTRAEVEAYLSSIGQPWREDESNLDQRFRRNRLRHELLPLLEREYNPNICHVLSESAEISRAEEEYWQAALEPVVTVWRDMPGRLCVTDLGTTRLAMQRRLMKRFLELEGIAFTFRHLERLRLCALQEVPSCKLPGGWMAQVDGGHLVVTKHRPPLGESDGYTVELPVPGEISVSGVVVRAVPVPAQFAAQAEPGTLLRAEALGERLIVRNWWPGDRYRPAHSGSEEKLKRLFSKRHVPVMPRRSWPVALKDRDIVYVYGFAVAEDYCWRVGDGDAIRIECTTIA